MAFAEKTDVPVSKTKGEIDALLRKHKATGFGTFEEELRAIVVFQMQGRRIQFILPLPDQKSDQFKLNGRNQMRTPDKRFEAWEQTCRSRWRALFLCIKAKLESIESKIETFDEAFLAHIMVASGHTVIQEMSAQKYLEQATTGMPPLLAHHKPH